MRWRWWLSIGLVVLVASVACGGARPPPRAPPAVATAPAASVPLRGTNLSGAEFGAAIPGVYGRDYAYPTSKDVDYFTARGMTFFRIPFLWERLQPALRGELDAAELARLVAVVHQATSRGATVAVEPHDFARYGGSVVGSAAVPVDAFADFWSRVAARMKDEPRLWLNLMNEPHDLPTEQWVAATNLAIAGIRCAGFKGPILVPGNAWTGASHWAETWYGTPNSVAMLAVKDPGSNVVFEVHQYLDLDGGGSAADCVSAAIGEERLRGFVAWLRANGRQGFLGEIGAPDTPTCREAVTRAVAYVEGARDVMRGWAWWSAGPWWPDAYALALGPRSDGAERPQLGWLRPFLTCGAP